MRGKNLFQSGQEPRGGYGCARDQRGGDGYSSALERVESFPAVVQRSLFGFQRIGNGLVCYTRVRKLLTEKGGVSTRGRGLVYWLHTPAWVPGYYKFSVGV